ncbi:hypothetical protein [Psychrobacter sp.]|uniref:hypothetical protein n=1 Tax=Psychrobacter sp. TaxID=56811 RepID=UPI003002D2A0
MIIKKFSPYEEFGIDEKVRVVIYDLSSKSYIIKEFIEPRQTHVIQIENSYLKDNLKFKYQIYDNSKWKDVFGGNRDLFNISSKDLLNNVNYLKNNRVDISSLCNAKDSQLSYALKYMLKNIYEYLFSDPSVLKIQKTKDYLNIFNEEVLLHSDIISHFHSQLTILVRYIDYCERQVFIENVENCLTLLDKIISEYDFNHLEVRGIKSGTLVAKGNILSIYDRTLAYKNYQWAKSIGESYISGFLAVDALTTYYSQIPDYNDTYSIEEHKNNYSNNKLNVCFSTDPSYFKMFGFTWVQASFYFENLNFNFGLVVESRELFESIVKNYNYLIRAYANFINQPVPKNNNFFWIRPNIINKTVFACARFYLSKFLLKKYSNDVYISDIDQLVIGDLDSYLSSIASDDFTHSVHLPVVSNYYKFLPGRSHLAGNIYIRNDEQGKKFADLLTNYVGIGMEEKHSWMLDQNATRYASETVPVEDIKVYGRRVLKQYPDFKIALRKK